MRAFYMLAVARHAHKSGRELTASLNQAKPNTLTENDSEICATVCNKDDVINLGGYNINDDTTSMMTAIVQPSTKTPPVRN